MVRLTGLSWGECEHAMLNGLRWCSKGSHWAETTSFRAYGTGHRARICEAHRNAVKQGKPKKRKVAVPKEVLDKVKKLLAEDLEKCFIAERMGLSVVRIRDICAILREEDSYLDRKE